MTYCMIVSLSSRLLKSGRHMFYTSAFYCKHIVSAMTLAAYQASLLDNNSGQCAVVSFKGLLIYQISIENICIYV